MIGSSKILLTKPNNTFPAPNSINLFIPLLDRYEILSLHLTGYVICFINDILTSLGSKISLAVTFETMGILKLLSFKSKIQAIKWSDKP